MSSLTIINSSMASFASYFGIPVFVRHTFGNLGTMCLLKVFLFRAVFMIFAYQPTMLAHGLSSVSCRRISMLSVMQVKTAGHFILNEALKVDGNVFVASTQVKMFHFQPVRVFGFRSCYMSASALEFNIPGQILNCPWKDSRFAW